MAGAIHLLFIIYDGSTLSTTLKTGPLTTGLQWRKPSRRLGI
jgi:hypothetical protein